MSLARPKGPLPARVYWTRRLLVLAVVVALVVGVGRLLGGQPARSVSPPPRPASAEGSPSGGGPTVSPSPTAGPTTPTEATDDPSSADDRTGAAPSPTKTPLAVPTGPCQDADVRVSPVVLEPAYAAQPVRVRLKLTTIESPACTWEVSPRSVVLRITSGTDRIWSTQDCPSAMPTEPLVVRKERAAAVELTWSGRRSDGTCSNVQGWSRLGWYHATAAAYGGEPTEVQFRLGRKPAERVTPKPKPKRDRGRSSEEPEAGARR